MNEKLRSEKRENNCFLQTHHKRWQCFLHRYIYIYNYNNKIIYMFIYNKSLKKCLRLFNKTFSNYQAAYLMEFYLLFEKSGNFFHTVSIEIGLTPPLPLLFVFIRSLRTPLPPPQQQTLCWKRWKELMIILVHSCI